MRRAALLLVSVVVIGACGGDDGGEVALVDGVTEDVTAVDSAFESDSVTVEAGTEVVWTNDGILAHNVILDDGEVLIPTDDFATNGTTGSHRFTEVGTFDYYCSIHGTPGAGMIGTIEVVALADTEPEPDPAP